MAEEHIYSLYNLALNWDKVILVLKNKYLQVKVNLVYQPKQVKTGFNHLLQLNEKFGLC